MKKWEVLHKFKIHPFDKLRTKFKIDELIEVLLEKRGIKTNKDRKEFLHPNLSDVTTESVGIDQKQLKKALKRITKAIADKEQIVVFGDYDVDGICGTAILWETLYGLGAKATPYIPHRIDEGYGLSIKGIQNVINVIPNSFRNLGSSEKTLKQVQGDNGIKLIITVDNGIVANEAVHYAKKQGIDVIITDHHVPSKSLPKANAIVHTTKLCGTGVAYLLAQEMLKQVQHDKNEDNHLELVALATVADLVPLVGPNRTLLKFGIEKLRTTERVGLVELFEEAGIRQSEIDTYHIGYIIAPRLNAMGRMEYAMDSLRLLCTKNKQRARLFAQKLHTTNKERQLLTEETAMHAVAQVRNSSEVRKLLFITHETYQQGVIGLVAGKLVEEFYRPAIVVSIGDKLSKASARSIAGFNIIEFIRSASDLLVDAGGHPMAAGFTVETTKLTLLQTKFSKLADKMLTDNMFTKTLKIDCELPISVVADDLYTSIGKLSPFGMGNPTPTFLSRNVSIEEMRLVGKERKHLKLQFRTQNSEFRIDGIAFGMGEKATELHVGDRVDIVYTIDQDRWPARNATQRVAGGNGNKKLQLKIKDLKLSKSLRV